MVEQLCKYTKTHWILHFKFLVVQSLSHIQLCDPMDCSTAGFPLLHYLLELAQTHVHWVDDATQPFHPLSPPFLLPSTFASIRVFSSESALPIRYPKYWSFGFSISPSNKYSGLISFGIDWFDLLALQGTLKSLLQHHSSKASVLWHLAFFMVSHICTWRLKKLWLWLSRTLSANWCLCFLIRCLGWS